MHAARFIVVHRVLNPPRPRNLTRAMRRRHAKLAPETFSPFPLPPPPFLQPGKIDRTFDLSHLSSPRFSVSSSILLEISISIFPPLRSIAIFFSMAIFPSTRWSSRFFFFMKFFSDLRSSDFVFWIIFSSNRGDFCDDIDNYWWSRI